MVRREMRDWVVTEERDRWTVKLDVRDLGWHLDTTLGVGRLLLLNVFVLLGCLLSLLCLFIFMVGWVSSRYVYSWCFAWY